jgi:hypothetical protein
MPARQLRVRKPVIALTAALATAAALATGLTVQQTAVAGTNGTQLRLCTHYNAYQVDVKGLNQDGTATKTSVGLADHDSDGDGCVYASDYWWKGTVHLTWHYVGNLESTLSENDCVIPDNLPDNYFDCVDENGDNQQPDSSETGHL